MTLYQEIIFLKHFFKGKYCVENVVPYYDTLIHGNKRGRHIFWTNFLLPNNLNARDGAKGIIVSGRNVKKRMEQFHDIDLSTYNGVQRKDKIAKNLVDYQVGKTIFDVARGIINDNNTEQGKLEF